MSKLLRFLPEQCEDVKQGRKTMTRRPVEWNSSRIKRQPGSVYTRARGTKWVLNWTSQEPDWCYGVEDVVCPYGAVGDIVPLLYPSDYEFNRGRITSLAVERVQDISEADCIAEGCPPEYLQGRNWFFPLWDGIYADKGLGIAEKPWVWVVGFRVVG